MIYVVCRYLFDLHGNHRGALDACVWLRGGEGHQRCMLNLSNESVSLLGLVAKGRFKF